MTIHVSKDAESAINAAVQSGQFASADEMVDRLVQEYAQRHRHVSMDPNRYEVSEPELLRGLRRFRWGSYLQDQP